MEYKNRSVIIYSIYILEEEKKKQEGIFEIIIKSFV